MKLSVLMPVFNERYYVRECVRRVLAAELPAGLALEIIIVDDFSDDGSFEILTQIARGQAGRIQLARHERNRGKGACIRTAIGLAEGDILLIQDSDLEYDPKDYAVLLQPILDGEADAVFGSRFVMGHKRRALFFWHALANKLVTTFSNLFTNLNLTDMETGYKAALAPFLKNIPIRCDRFGVEPEITAKLAKQGCRIYEVPIRYCGRTYEEGKKISAWDAVKAFAVVVYFWLVDDLHDSEHIGRGILNQMSHTPNFNRWMAMAVDKYVGHKAVEIGAGIGNISSLLCHREMYVASDRDEYYYAYLSRRFANRPNVRVAKIDLALEKDFERLDGELDSVICLNVLEHVDDDLAALKNMRRILTRQGRLILLVPQAPFLYGTLDVALEHRRRYRKRDICALLKKAGFDVERIFDFNRISAPAWLINGRLLRRTHFGRFQLKFFDWMIWIFRRIDWIFPWPGQSLIVIGRNNGLKHPESDL